MKHHEGNDLRSLWLVCMVVALASGLLLAAVSSAEEYGEPIVLGPVDPEIDRGFGYAVAIDRNTLAVGVPDSPEGGVVYVYERRKNHPDGWKLMAMLRGRNPADNERFGSSVALDGTVLVVGSPHENSRADYSGAAYVHYRDRGGPANWGRVRTLTPRNLGYASHYGESVSISGDLVAVGAPGAGTVYVHERNAPIRNWFGIHSELEGEVTSRRLQEEYPWAERAGGFGRAVSLSGKTLAVGAFDCCFFTTPSSHSFGIFIFDLLEDPESGETEWSQLFNFESPALRRHGTEDDFGRVLQLHGPLLLAGGAQSDGSGCHLYERNHRGRNRWGYRTEMGGAVRDWQYSRHVYGLAVRGKSAAVSGQFQAADGSYSELGTIVYDRHLPTRDSWGVAARLAGTGDSIAIGPREVVIGNAGVVQIFPRAPLVAADFEDGDTSGLSRATGNVEVTSPGLAETEYALRVSADGTTKRSLVRARHPHRETTLSLGFDLAANRVALAGRQVEIMNLYGPSRELVRLTLEADPGFDQYWVRLAAWEQGDGWRDVGKARMPPLRSVRMEIEWRAATGPGHENGRVRLYTDGRLKARAEDLDTDLQFVNGLLLGLPKGSQGTAGGAFLLDEIELHR